MGNVKQYKRRFVVTEEMYNEDVKNRFIDYYYDNEQTKLNIKRTFYLTNFYMEKDLDKDIYNFNKYEIESLLKSFKATSEGSLAVRLTHIKKYIDFCISMGIRSNAINFCDTIANLKDYVVRNLDKYKYITREQLYNICDIMESSQIAVIFILFFEGIVGKEKCEMRNLKVEDVDFDNNSITIRAYDEINPRTGEIIHKPERILTNVHPRTMEYIKDAIEETVMIMPESKLFTDPEKDMAIKTGKIGKNPAPHYVVQNDYVVRKSSRKLKDINEEEENTPVSVSTITNRIYYATDYFEGNENLYFVKKLNTTTLEQSGMIEQLEKIEAKKGKLVVQDFKDVIASRNKRTYHSLKRLWDSIKKEKSE
ncbi:site-specific integrase [Clostridium botulinum]|uniref:site-specific integrase n=1 Tax=Clostridium botulinum TaxID=1491 RepID=UPI0004D93FBB|nr:site-specific integrase [Clostridium botulinum]KEH96453.1 conserved hypothetical phage-related protein [Clostridium botulinum D str. 16868]